MDKSFDKLDEFILGNPGADYPAEYLDHALRPRNAGSRDGANGFAALRSHDGRHYGSLAAGGQ